MFWDGAVPRTSRTPMTITTTRMTTFTMSFSRVLKLVGAEFMRMPLASLDINGHWCCPLPHLGGAYREIQFFQLVKR